ncbi:MAG TPA: hypothetical protein VF077_12370 [Nitrospiraceae bacterium]
MARPATEAALYQGFTLRLPRDISRALQTRSADSGISQNALIIAILRRALRLPAVRVVAPETEQAS